MKPIPVPPAVRAETGGRGARRAGIFRSPRAAAAVIAAAAAALMAVAACSSRPSATGTGQSPNAGTSASSPDAGGSANTQLVAFSRCVRSDGVPDFPDPQAGASNEKFPGAQQL